MKRIQLMILFVVVLVATAAYSQQTVYYPKLLQISNQDMGKAKSEFADLLKATEIYYKTNPKSNPKSASVFDDRIELAFKKVNATLYFSYLVNYAIKVTVLKDVTQVIPKGSPNPVFLDENQIRIGDFVFSEYTYSNTGSSESYDWKLADYLYFFQYLLISKQYDSLIAAFKPIASGYCALKVKPAVSEEQRKYIVQANVLNQQKMYEKAIELYSKAVEIDQTAYPAAYSNLALLSAQTGRYSTAIYYMKKYLLLEPESADARSAQDKIYEWEILMQQ